MTEKEIYDDFVNELMRVITGIDSVLARMYETSAPKQYKETRGHVRRAKMALVDALETYVQQAYSDDGDERPRKESQDGLGGCAGNVCATSVLG